MAEVELLGESIKLTDKQYIAWQLIKDTRYKFIKFWGGSRSGKTFIICLYFFLRAIKYSKSDHIICRYDKQKAKNTVWRQTMKPLLEIGEKAGICKINHSEQYAKFTNGSMISLGGLRPSDIGNILSAEYATFFCCEANEMAWETIDLAKSRLNSNSVNDKNEKIQCKFLIDLNPTFSRHWSNVSWMQGIDPDTREPLKEFNKYTNLHFLPEDNMENLSKDYLETLDSMTGSRRRRFREGVYGTYDGLVYSCFEDHHIIDDFRIPNDWLKVRAIDFGYSEGHAFVCIWMALDESNEKIIIYREYVKEKTVVRIHAGNIKDLSKLDGFYTYGNAVCDHDAEDRATLEENGIKTKPANKSVLVGIDKMIDFIERGKFNVFRSCTETITELGSYIWKNKDTGISKDREVVKENDNCLDAIRYGIMDMFSNKRQNMAVPM